MDPYGCDRAAAAFCAVAADTRGGVISDLALADVNVSGSGGMISAFTSVTTPIVGVNNDDTSIPSLSTVTITEAFVVAAPSFIDLEISVTNSGGVTEYFATKNVANLLNQAASGFTIQLGIGTGANFALATAANAPGLDFDAPSFTPAPFSATFSSINTTANQISLSGGVLQTGQANATDVTFSIDVPDNLPNGMFTIRESLTAVPEPSALALLGLPSLAFLRRRRRRA
ncbi:MAG: PEP-CTERM sorting domain-containing protein [Pseudomonadota bacterium]|nr:PEP-CTERM sorting domain-containing protein [Pseudomonadota bacterium]